MKHIREYLEDPGCHTPSEIDIYLNGDCDLFAIAVSRMTGWSIGIIVEPRLVIESAQVQIIPSDGSLPNNDKPAKHTQLGLVHAFCYNDEKQDMIFDAKGWRDANSLNKEYALHADCSVHLVTEHEVINLVHPIQPLNKTRLMETITFIQRYYTGLISSGEQP